MPHWVKSHGLGNDYIVMVEDRLPLPLNPERVRLICHRNYGVGSDGILLLVPSERADFGLRIFNPDGSEAEKSGNGVRIFGKFLWDHGFQVSPEDRMGALFWRMHRSARIIFSMSFHLGKMSPDQAVKFLVDTVAFERANAEAEVRRSFGGQYSPLYQIAYMIGGLELRALHKELVDTKKLTERQFHDAVFEGGPMPIVMVRARLAKTPLTRDGDATMSPFAISTTACPSAFST